MKVETSKLKMTTLSTDRPCRKNGRKISSNNKDLLNGVHNKNCWHQKFIPTFLWWVAKQLDPWSLNDDNVINALQQIWDIVYSNIPYMVKQKGPIIVVVMYNFFDTLHDINRMTGNAMRDKDGIYIKLCIYLCYFF